MFHPPRSVSENWLFDGFEVIPGPKTSNGRVES